MDTPTLTLPSGSRDFAAILFGLECATTAIVLRDLLSAGVAISLICLPGPSTIPLLRTTRHRTLPIASAHPDAQSVAGLANSAEIPLWRIGKLHASEVNEALQSVEANLVIVACYNRLIPSPLYEKRTYGGINLHPSLLPDKRGPDPLFWVFKQDDPIAGSTVHRLTSQFDAGDILGQAHTPKPDGITEAELDVSLARLGAGLIVQTIEALASGTTVPREQPEAEATWAPHPSRADFQLDRARSARSAFNFFKGLAGRGHRFTVEMDGQTHTVDEVHGWSHDVQPTTTDPEDLIIIEFAQGWLIASFEPLT